jgi:hypothetical protein
MPDGKVLTELLMSILDCGIRDLEELEKKIELAMKFNITVDDIVDYVFELGAVDFNTVMYATMNLTLTKIAEKAKERGEDDVANELMNWPIFVDYFDSSFMLESLDSLKAIGKSAEELVNDVIAEVKSKKYEVMNK